MAFAILPLSVIISAVTPSVLTVSIALVIPELSIVCPIFRPCLYSMTLSFVILDLSNVCATILVWHRGVGITRIFLVVIPLPLVRSTTFKFYFAEPLDLVLVKLSHISCPVSPNECAFSKFWIIFYCLFLVMIPRAVVYFSILVGHFSLSMAVVFLKAAFVPRTVWPLECALAVPLNSFPFAVVFFASGVRMLFSCHNCYFFQLFEKINY